MDTLGLKVQTPQSGIENFAAAKFAIFGEIFTQIFLLIKSSNLDASGSAWYFYETHDPPELLFLALYLIRDTF